MWAYCSTHDACSEVCYAAAVVWLRMYWGIYHRDVDVTNTAGVIRTSLILDLSQSVNLLTFTFYPTLKLKLSASADQHASVILRSKTARCSDCFCFSFKRFWSPTVVHLQWSLTSSTMWFDSMQSKRGHEGQISVLDSRCSYSSFPPVSCRSLHVYMQLFCSGGYVWGAFRDRKCVETRVNTAGWG